MVTCAAVVFLCRKQCAVGKSMIYMSFLLDESIVCGIAFSNTLQGHTCFEAYWHILFEIETHGDGFSIAWLTQKKMKKTRCSRRTRMLTRMLMVQMSKHMDMQSRRTLFCNSLFEQSCTYFACYQSAVWSGKCECGVWSGKCRVWSVECKVRSVECKVWSGECRVCKV